MHHYDAKATFCTNTVHQIGEVIVDLEAMVDDAERHGYVDLADLRDEAQRRIAVLRQMCERYGVRAIVYAAAARRSAR